MATKSTSKANELLQENKNLKEQIEQLRQMVEGLTKNQNNIVEIKTQKEKVIEEEYDEIIEIPMFKPIKIMSLFTGGLNLKTSNDSNAQVFRFTKFGEVQPIIYQDLVKIVSNQRSFFEKGYCMALDKDFNKLHLYGVTEKIIDAKTIENFLEYDENKIQTIFNGVTEEIKTSIVDIIIQKLNKNENIDRNKVSLVGKLFGHDIFELANKIK